MFKSSKPNKQVNVNSSSLQSPSINLVGPGTVIEGEMYSNGDVRIDGKVDGYVNSKAKVVLGPKGTVTGNIECDSADISGLVNGQLNVKGLLFLKSTAKITGDIVTGKLVVESGAIINGTCSMGDAKKLMREEPIKGKFKKEAV